MPPMSEPTATDAEAAWQTYRDARHAYETAPHDSHNTALWDAADAAWQAKARTLTALPAHELTALTLSASDPALRRLAACMLRARTA